MNGLRYGTRRNSRTEVKLESSQTKELERDAKIELKFSAASISGLLLLLVDSKFIDHTLVYLLRGRLHCSFNPGSGTLELEFGAELSTNGSQWHRLSIVRESRKVKIFVDEKEVKSGTLPGDKTALTVNPVLFVGSLPRKLVESASAKMHPALAIRAEFRSSTVVFAPRSMEISETVFKVMKTWHRTVSHCSKTPAKRQKSN